MIWLYFHINIYSITIVVTISFMSEVYIRTYLRVNTRPDSESTIQKLRERRKFEIFDERQIDNY